MSAFALPPAPGIVPRLFRNVVLLPLFFSASTVMAGGDLGLGCVVGNLFDAHKKIAGYVEYTDRRNLWDVHPQVSVYSGDGNFCYGCLGLRYRRATGPLRVALSSNVGLFDARGYNPLGCPVEFLSYLEVQYVLGRHYAIGMAFGHISNAHLSSVNPGSEFVRIGLAKSI